MPDGGHYLPVRMQRSRPAFHQAAAALEELPDDRPDDIRAKELASRRQEETGEYRHKKKLADGW